MNLLCCRYKCSCTTAAIIASVIVGVVTAFLQITGVFTLAAAFLWVAFGIAVGYLGLLVLAAALTNRASERQCLCPALTAVLAGILGTVLLALVLLAVGITATSILSAILVGLLLFFLALTLTATACLVKCMADCE